MDNSSVVFLGFSKQSFGFIHVQLNEELALACNIYAGEKYLYCYCGYYLLYLIAYLIILELATMNPLGQHSPHLVDNTDSIYLGDQHW